MTEHETIERDEVSWKNSTALSSLMAQYGLAIPAADFPNWRPTVRSGGEIPGVAQNVTIIATNGLLAYFIVGDDETIPVLCGHIQCFTGEVKTLFSSKKQKALENEENKTRKRRARKSQQELAMELLKELTAK